MDSRIEDLKRGVEELESRVSSLEEEVVDPDTLLHVKAHHRLNSSRSTFQSKPQKKSTKTGGGGAEGGKKGPASGKVTKPSEKSGKGPAGEKAAKAAAPGKPKAGKGPAADKASKGPAAEKVAKVAKAPAPAKAPAKAPAGDKAPAAEKAAKAPAKPKTAAPSKAGKGPAAGKAGKGAAGGKGAKRPVAGKGGKRLVTGKGKGPLTGKGPKGQVLKGVPGKSGKITKKKKASSKFHIDCRQPVEDGIMNAADFETYLTSRIKINGKKNNMSNKLTLERNKNKITINAEVNFSKRYLKYLTKKYLKKNNLRDWLRVVAPPTMKDTYELRYFQINNDEDDDEDGDE